MPKIATLKSKFSESLDNPAEKDNLCSPASMKEGSTMAAEGRAMAAAGTALRVGIDLGTNTTVFQVSQDGKPLPHDQDFLLSLVGYPKAGIIPGILPSDAEVLFGEEALDFRIHLDLKWPLKDGFVDDVNVCKQFTAHLRRMIDPKGEHRLWGVVGSPAHATPERLKEIRAAMVGVLDRMVVVPEPFLAAMGLRDDAGFKKNGAASDPTKHSLIVDIGAGTTDLCLVRGYFPTEEDQISFAKAGNFIDENLFQLVQRRYPDLKLTRVTLTQLKEKHSYVGEGVRHAMVKVYVDGRPQQLDFGELIHEACEALVPDLVNGVKTLLKRCDSDVTEKVLQNIILTGGGSQIDGICERVQEALRNDGFDEATTLKPADYKHLVARGALKIAENVRDDQWQVPF
ncbi:MAG: rod shape-determining protein [Planctomycetes bacterium]|nr:rod shape-determining protein [Planctomycetota bacterium]